MRVAFDQPMPQTERRDSLFMSLVCPISMIFIPCKDGISHNELGDAKPDHLAAGCNVLLHAMLSQAGVGARGGQASNRSSSG